VLIHVHGRGGASPNGNAVVVGDSDRARSGRPLRRAELIGQDSLGGMLSPPIEPVTPTRSSG
jgi:hypothetical protein